MQLASRFRNAVGTRSDHPLSDDEIRAVAPSIFAEAAHESRSARYTYIPTIDVLSGLRREGFQPFMVCQTRVRDEGKREHTKHMIRLRHADQITGREANEIILLNSHDGTSSYQMLAGMFRFVCQNGMVCGEMTNDVRVRHNGNVVGEVIDGAFKVLDSFEVITEQCESMQALTLNQGEQSAFARAALALKYDDETGAAPVTESQVLKPRRIEDRRDDMWTTFNRLQENLLKGGLRGLNKSGRTTTTRPVSGIDQSVKLNRALWILAEEMRRLKG
ncbi:DUF932 domain-containing protein (plasmid) [Ralstonia pseudosolanacearum]